VWVNNHFRLRAARLRHESIEFANQVNGALIESPEQQKGADPFVLFLMRRRVASIETLRAITA
jgi:hypothetical protein